VCARQAAVLVARYAGQPSLKAKVEAAVRVQQNNDNAVRCVVYGRQFSAGPSR
jgi:hypothetical protein